MSAREMSLTTIASRPFARELCARQLRPRRSPCSAAKPTSVWPARRRAASAGEHVGGRLELERQAVAAGLLDLALAARDAGGSRRRRRPSAARRRPGTPARTPRCSSAAVTTSRRAIAGCVGSATLAATSVTSAPRASAASASAKPMRPEELLPRKRTLSIGSRVPPAVTSTLTPRQLPAPRLGRRCVLAAARRRPRPRRSRALPRTRPAAAPARPGARRPARPWTPGARCRARRSCTPRSRSVCRLARVAACSYMWLFIAGATSTGHVGGQRAAAEQVVGQPGGELGDRVRRGRRDQVHVGVAHELQVAERIVRGQRVAGKAPRAGSRSNSLTSTGAPLSAANDASPTKRGWPASARRAPRARRRSPGARARAPCRRRSRR